MVNLLPKKNDTSRLYKVYSTRWRCGSCRKLGLMAVMCFFQAAHLNGMERAMQDASSASKLSHAVNPPSDKSAESLLSSSEIVSTTAAYREDTQHRVEKPATQIITFKDLSNPRASENKVQQASRRQKEDPPGATQVFEPARTETSDSFVFSNDPVQSKLQQFNFFGSKDHQPSDSHHILQEEYDGNPNHPKRSRLNVGSLDQIAETPRFEQLWKNAGVGFYSSPRSNPVPEWQTEYPMNPTESVHGSWLPHMAGSKEKTDGLERLAKSAGCEIPTAEKIWKNARPGALSFLGSGSGAKELRAELGKRRGVSRSQDHEVLTSQERPTGIENPLKADGTRALSAAQLWENAHAGEFSLWNADSRLKESNIQTVGRSDLPPWSQEAHTEKEDSPAPKSVNPHRTEPTSLNQIWPSARGGELLSWNLSGQARELGVTRKVQDVMESLSAGNLWDSARPGMLTPSTPSLTIQKMPVQQNKKKKSVSWAPNFDGLTGTKQFHHVPERARSENLEVPPSFSEHVWETVIAQDTEPPSWDHPREVARPRKSFLRPNSNEEDQAQVHTPHSAAAREPSRAAPRNVMGEKFGASTFYRSLQKKLYESLPSEMRLAIGMPIQVLPEKAGKKLIGSRGQEIDPRKYTQRNIKYWEVSVARGSEEAIRLTIKEPITSFVNDLVRGLYGNHVTPAHRVFQRHTQWLLDGIYSLLFQAKIVGMAFPLISVNQQEGLDGLLKKAWDIYKSIWEQFYEVSRDDQASWQIKNIMTTQEFQTVIDYSHKNLSRTGDKGKQLLAARRLLLLWLGEVSPILYRDALLTGPKMEMQENFSAIMNDFIHFECFKADAEAPVDASNK